MVAPLVLPAALLVLALVCAFLIATSKGYQYTFGVVLAKVADVFDRIRLPLPSRLPDLSLGRLGDAVRSVNSFVQAKLGEGIDATSHAMIRVYGQTANTFAALGESLGDLAVGTEKALGQLRRHTIPVLIGAAIGPLGLSIDWLKRHAHETTKAVSQAATTAPKVIVKTITRVEHKTVTLARTIYKTAPVAVAAAIAIPGTAIKRIERRETAIEKWIKAHRHVVTQGAFAALLVAALGKLGLGSLRCSNTKRFNNAVCKAPVSWLDGLLLGMVAIFGTLSLVELAKQTQGLTDEVSGAVRHFWRVDVAGASRNPGLGDPF